MRLKSTSFVAMALLSCMAVSQTPIYATNEPPHGEPFFKKLGEGAWQHCEHGTQSDWYLSGTRPSGWRYFTHHPNPWAYYYPTANWVFSGSVPPSTHLTKKVWALNMSYPGPHYPPYDPQDPNLVPWFDIPFNNYWVQTIAEECLGETGAGE